MILSINQDPDVTMVLDGSTGCSELTLMVWVKESWLCPSLEGGSPSGGPE